MTRRWMSLLALILGFATQTQALTYAQSSTMTAGEVTKLDKETGRITLRHAEIKHLDMPPMTMVFRVREPKILEGVNVGDRIRFAAERIDGNYTVVAINKAP
jgi:Cu(I)/Ag(I) efflux system periplasmic protein CusF